MNELTLGSKGWKLGKLKGSKGLHKEGCSVEGNAVLRGVDSCETTHAV